VCKRSRYDDLRFPYAAPAGLKRLNAEGQAVTRQNHRLVEKVIEAAGGSMGRINIPGAPRVDGIFPAA
jgi:hypothetical protein